MLHVKKFSLLLFIFLTILGCKSSLPLSEGSVLVLAVSGLGSDEFGDGSSTDNITANLEKLVKESVRFTHAYTTSPLEAAGLGSLLTGVYPFESGIKTNGASNYLEEVKSIPEQVWAQGYYNFFLSGGPPFLRKSGVSRGFNDFDDSFNGDDSFYLKAAALSEKFLSLYENKMETNRFLGVIYFPDILFSANTSKEKALQEIDEAIGKIRNRLLELKTWDELTVVFTSLRGQGRFEGLYDDMVRVPLVIKPSRKHRDLAPSWKIDWSVNFADLGKTLHAILNIKFHNKTHLDVKDFSRAMSTTDFAKDIPDSQRVLFGESDLQYWRGWGEKLYSVRQGEWVLFPKNKKLFNTYIDRGQINNMYAKDADATLRLEKNWQMLQVSDDKKNTHPSAEAAYKINLAKTLFALNSPLSDIHNAFQDFSITRDDWQVNQWYFSTLYERKDFDKLKKALGKTKAKNKAEKRDLLLWKKHLGIASDKETVDCERVFEKRQKDILRECKDKETLAWVQSFISYKAKRNKEAALLYDYARGMTYKRQRQNELAKYFWINNTSWDLSLELPGELAIFDYVLAQAANSEFESFFKKKPSF